MQNIIWAYNRTPPRSSDADTDISIYHRIGHGILNLMLSKTPHIEPQLVHTPSKLKPVFPALPRPPVPPIHNPGSDPTAARKESEKGETFGENHRGGGFASIMHGTLCMTGFLLVLPSGMLVVQSCCCTSCSARSGAGTTRFQGEAHPCANGVAGKPVCHNHPTCLLLDMTRPNRGRPQACTTRLYG